MKQWMGEQKCYFLGRKIDVWTISFPNIHPDVGKLHSQLFHFYLFLFNFFYLSFRFIEKTIYFYNFQ